MSAFYFHQGTKPLLVSMPHVGLEIPDNIKSMMTDEGLTLIDTDWYIDQTKRAAYEGAPVPISFTHEEYQQGTRDVVYYRPDPRVKGRMPIDNFVTWLKSNDKSTTFNYGKKQLKAFFIF